MRFAKLTTSYDGLAPDWVSIHKGFTLMKGKINLFALDKHPRICFLLFVLCGAIGVLSFAPFEVRLLLPVGLAFLFFHLYCMSPKRGFKAGYAYGLGMMGVGVSWMQVSLAQFGEVNELLAAVYTLGFIAFVALYFGLAGWLIAWLSGRRAVVGLILVTPAVWVLVEWIRGWFLTGFPWLVTGYAMIDTPLAGYGPVLGVYGISWITALLAGFLALIALEKTPNRLIMVSAAMLLFLVGAALQRVQWSESAGEPIKVAIVQANIEQKFKWNSKHFGKTVNKHLELTRKNRDADLIIWPETAVSAFEHSVRSFLLDPLEKEALKNKTEMLIGMPVMGEKSERYYNAMRNLGGEGGAYFKRHLVPFGEYAPFRSVLKPFVDSLGVPMSDFMPGDAEKPLLKINGHLAGISICYEDAFGEEMIQAMPEAAFLINASNDGWFGDTFAPYQHLEIARMRAVESSRYLIRSTNTGVSAVIEPGGKVVAQAPMFEQAVLNAEVTPLTGATIYSRVGNWLIVSILSLLLLLVGLTGRRNAFR